MKKHKLLLYLGLTFALSWAYGFGYFALGGSLTAVSFLPVVSIYMFIPAITAVLLQKLLYKAPLSDIGLRWRWNRWLPIAAVVPFVFLLLTIAIGGLLPGVRWATVAEIAGVLLTAVPPEQAATLQSLGILLPLILLGGGLLSAIIAAFTINGLFALGEELGWRGLVYEELIHLGFWRSSLIIGTIWGLWHLPIIANGYNYPQHPTAGIFMMTLFTIGLTPLHLFVREKAGTVLAPGIWWNKFSGDGRNINQITPQDETDMGGGATFYDTLVMVEAVATAKLDASLNADIDPQASPEREKEAIYG